MAGIKEYFLVVKIKKMTLMIYRFNVSYSNFILFYFGFISGSAQGMVLIMCSRFLLVKLGRPYIVPDSKQELAEISVFIQELTLVFHILF